MNRTPSRLWFLALAVALVLPLAGMVTAASAAVSCEATVKATPDFDRTYQDRKDKIFRVEITSSAGCGKVYIDLVTTELLFNGEQITTTRREWRKTSGSTNTVYQYTYSMAPDSSLLSWEFKVNRCVVCGTD